MQSTLPLSDDVRIALRRLARAVAVITCHHDGRQFAMAATAVTEVSLDPPSLLICVNRSAALYEPLSAGAGFCVNVLRRSQEPISRACSGEARGEARFKLGHWSSNELEPPCLEDAQANFFCRSVWQKDHGTHGIFIGEIVRVAVNGTIDPLIYLDGQYMDVEANRRI